MNVFVSLVIILSVNLQYTHTRAHVWDNLRDCKEHVRRVNEALNGLHFVKAVCVKMQRPAELEGK